MTNFTAGRFPLAALLSAAFAAGCGGGGASAVDPVTPAAAELANRPPQVEAIDDMQNSAESLTSHLQVVAIDPDGDPLAYAATVADAGVAHAAIDADGMLVLQPLAAGTTGVTVTVSDGARHTAVTFAFSVGEVTRVAQVVTSGDGSDAIVLENTGDQPMDFILRHNGFRTYETIADMLADVQALPAEHAGERFERKLWRFVRDNVYHDHFLNPSPWLMSPTTLINSLGFGLCSSVAATYVELARAAGHEARIWALTGHVVPEIRVAGRWALYDPDLAVYYHDSGFVVAGVEDLAAMPTLITAPLEPVLGAQDAAGYSGPVAAIYASRGDNFTWDSLLDLPEGLPGRVVLPPGARLVYQGRWTVAPLAYGDDNVPREVANYQQAALEVPGGWTGTLPLPWIAWDVQGAGRVRVDGVEFAVGSDSLRQRLQESPAPVPRMDVTAADGMLRIVFLVNPLRYEAGTSNRVEMTGQNVWQLHVAAEQLPVPFRAGPPFPDALRKPVR